MLTLVSFTREIGVDLGTSKLAIYSKEKGIAHIGPSVVGRRGDTREVVAAGWSALEAASADPGSIELTRPVRGGHIQDLDMAVHLLDRAIRGLGLGPVMSHPCVLAAAPCHLTSLQRRTLVQALELSGARSVEVVSGVVTAAAGAGLDPSSTDGTMLVDIGAGHTDVALISMGEVVYSETLPVGGDSMNEAVCGLVRQQCCIELSEAMSEEIKLGAFRPGADTVRVKGIRAADGLPGEASIPSADIVKATCTSVPIILEAVARVLEKAGPELSGDIVNRGIIFTGGAASLPGLSRAVNQRLGLPVSIADGGALACARGFARLLERPAWRVPHPARRAFAGLALRLGGR